MNTFVQDLNVVGETEATLVEFLPAAASDNLLILRNAGVNTMNYRIQQFNGTTWVDIDISGTDYYNSLASGVIKTVRVLATYPRHRIVGNASGGSTLDFSSVRLFSRAPGGQCPLLSF